LAFPNPAFSNPAFSKHLIAAMFVVAGSTTQVLNFGKI
jgi:hypothetical protein